MIERNVALVWQDTHDTNMGHIDMTLIKIKRAVALLPLITFRKIKSVQN